MAADPDVTADGVGTWQAWLSLLRAEDYTMACLSHL